MAVRLSYPGFSKYLDFAYHKLAQAHGMTPGDSGMGLGCRDLEYQGGNLLQQIAFCRAVRRSAQPSECEVILKIGFIKVPF